MKIVTLEVYSCSMFNDVNIRQPTSLDDAIRFLERAISDPAFVDIYLDINNDQKPCYQKTFALCGCENKQDAIQFIKTVWSLI